MLMKEASEAPPPLSTPPTVARASFGVRVGACVLGRSALLCPPESGRHTAGGVLAPGAEPCGRDALGLGRYCVPAGPSRAGRAGRAGAARAGGAAVFLQGGRGAAGQNFAERTRAAPARPRGGGRPRGASAAPPVKAAPRLGEEGWAQGRGARGARGYMGRWYSQRVRGRVGGQAGAGARLGARAPPLGRRRRGGTYALGGPREAGPSPRPSAPAAIRRRRL
jgi:hypothetical protein